MPIRLLLLAGAVVLLFAAAAPVSHARTACVDEILDEWVHPSKSIATTHALKCYDLALKEAPEDVLLYTNFETDVRSAKQAAVRSQQTNTPTSASPPPSPPPAASQPASAPAASPPQAPPPDGPPEQSLIIDPEQPVDEALNEVVSVDPLAVEPPPVVGEVVPIDEPAPVNQVESQAVDAPVIDVLRNIGPDDAGSVPLPLIIITVLSGLLAIIGATLLAARHVQTKRLAEAPPLPPRTPSAGGSDPTL